MTPLQKVVTLLIRFVALGMLGLGAMGVAYWALAREDARGLSSAVWIGAGLALFKGSKPLGRLMLNDLE